MMLETRYDPFVIVYLKTDTDQKPRQIVAFNWSGGNLLYELACGPSKSWHQEAEISDEANVLAKMNTE